MTRDDLQAHVEYFRELGVTGVNRQPEWRTRESSALAPANAGSTPPGAADAVADPPAGSAGRGAGRAQGAHRARLHAAASCTRSAAGNVVFGVGSPTASLMFVGEGPGEDEDRQGEPFVGRAGQLLTKIIEAIGLTREQVYIANVIKCRPPGNRNPEPDEVATCEPFLFEQIAAIRPRSSWRWANSRRSRCCAPTNRSPGCAAASSTSAAPRSSRRSIPRTSSATRRPSARCGRT